MGVEYDADKLDDLLRLTRENNRMLHAMRRNAFIGGLLRFVVWVALLVIPLWLYMHYVAPVMESTLNAMQQIQGGSAAAQAQFDGMQAAVEKIRAQFPQYFQAN